MTDHPLTDEMMLKIHGNRPGYSNPFDEEDMRAAYDLAIEHAVDWLECNAVICDDDEGYIYLKEDCFSETSINVDLLVADFKKALRPQKDSQ